jgi:predicted nuclease of predicted toxin-antitoxin system
VKIKLDENIPSDAVAVLGSSHDIDTVHSEGLDGQDDPTVFAAAQAESRFLVTQDLDFSDLRQFLPGTHPGVLLLRLRNPSRSELNRRLAELVASEDFESWAGCFVVATDSKVRVRRPVPS